MYARKIARAKWEKALEACKKNDDAIDILHFPADTLTSDLKTSSNTLSVWQVTSEEDAVLAMMTNNKSRVETIYILSVEELSPFELCATPGDTVVEDLVKHHVNIASLDYEMLGQVSKRFLEAFQSKKIRKFSKREVLWILRKALEDKRLVTEKLNEEVQGSLLKV